MANFFLVFSFIIFINANPLVGAQKNGDREIQGLDQISPHTPLTKARKLLGLDDAGNESEKKAKASSSPSSGKYLTPPASLPLLSLKKPSPPPSPPLAPAKK